MTICVFSYSKKCIISIIIFLVVCIILWNEMAYYLHKIDCLSIVYKTIKCTHKYYKVRV